MLPGMGCIQGGAAVMEAAGVTLADTETDLAVANNTWTTTVTLGAEPSGGATRHIIVLVSTNDNDVVDAFTTEATLGGSAITKITGWTHVAGSTTSGEYIGIIEMPTGTSAELIVTLTGFTGTMDAYAVAILRAININPLQVDTNNVATGYGIAEGAAVPLSVPSNGIGVLIGTSENGFSLGSWSGTGAVNIYNGTRAGAAMYRTNAGTVSHDASNYTHGAYATWQFS
jgi:hypothetical protein